MIELLAPAGNLERLEAALYYGADAVYLSGKQLSLRAFSDNFTHEELKNAINLVHSLGKKCYVTLNIFAFDNDFDILYDYAQYLYEIKADAVIVSDAGVFSCVRKAAPDLAIHISTQSNVTNKYAASFWAEQGAERIVLARELNLEQIKQIRDYLPRNVMLEAFVHGAMCMSYSGRCLLSNYLADRPSNRGECAQSCRWEYSVTERTRKGEQLDVVEDERGTYIFNSKDMNMLAHIDKLVSAGIESFKIEGRIKTAYYVANTVNAYRRAIDIYNKNPANFNVSPELIEELNKASHRKYCTGFYFGKDDMQCLETSRPNADYKFCAVVVGHDNNGKAQIEQRNRFKTGDELEILSPSDSFNKVFKTTGIFDENGNQIHDANLVQQKLFIDCPFKLQKGDMLRKKDA